MNKKNTIKLLAIFASGLGIAATLLSDWATGKEQEAIIEEKINEALAKRDEKEENEEES